MDSVSRLAMSTALLAKFNRTPNLPQNKPLKDHQEDAEQNARRVIPLKHEAIFVEQFAFVCAYSDDPLHVLAVCVEEDHQRGVATIRLAANTGRHKALLEGLKPITNILQCEACKANSMSRDQLLQAVVRLNRKRILSRIRSRHASSARARNKAPLLRRCRTFHSLTRELMSTQTGQDSLCEEFVVLTAQLEQLENMRTKHVREGRADELLCASIERAQRLVSSHQAEFDLVPCTPLIWREGETTSLLNRLRKFAHYAVACVELLRMARRYQIFSKIEVIFLDLQQIGPRTSTDAGFVLDQLVSEALPSNPRQVSASVRQALPAVQRAIKSELSGTSRLHAEIQLAVFYERNPAPLPPRVICSSKSACYLCDLFLEVQGKYCIPSTHGRLYEAWRWPLQDLGTGGASPHSSRPEFEAILGPFSKIIESKLQQLLRQSLIERHADPAESRVDFSGMMTPSITSGDQEILAGNCSTMTGSVQLATGSRKSSFSIYRQPSERAVKPSQQHCGHEGSEERGSPAISARKVLCQGSGLPNRCSDDRLSIIHHFTNEDRVFEIRMPDLEVEVLHIQEGHNPNNDNMSLSVEVVHLNDCDTTDTTLTSSGHVVDVVRCGFDEVSLPEGVAVDGGIVLRSGATSIKLRVVTSRAIEAGE